MDGKESLGRMLVLFLSFGLRAWGGPVAQIAMLRRELVERRAWISSERFNRLLAVYQALPGPEAHELCVHLGMVRRGRVGGLLAGLGFLLPGLVLVLAAAAIYDRVGPAGPAFSAALAGAQLAVIAMVLLAVWKIGRRVVSGWPTLAVAVGAGLLILSLPQIGLGQADAEAMLGPAAYFVTGLKGGMLSFGGAYTAIPVIRSDLVGPARLDDSTFLDAVAITSLLPSPLILFATFAAYHLGGPAGALALTAGMFLPAFGFGMIFYDRLEAVIDNQRLHRMLDLVAAVAVGMMAATAFTLFAGEVAGIEALLLTAAALALLASFRSAWAPPLILLVAAAAGMLLV